MRFVLEVADDLHKWLAGDYRMIEAMATGISLGRKQDCWGMAFALYMIPTGTYCFTYGGRNGMVCFLGKFSRTDAKYCGSGASPPGLLQHESVILWSSSLAVSCGSGVGHAANGGGVDQELKCDDGVAPLR